MSFKSGALAAAVALSLALSAGAQDDSGSDRTVYGAVVFARHGELTPVILPEQSKLTPLGAQQMLDVGSMFRQRYVMPFAANENQTFPNEPIVGISASILDNEQLYALSPIDEGIYSSAQAFFQGLYPPTNVSDLDQYVSDLSAIANGSQATFPLGGFQYPQIASVSVNDPDVVWIAGQSECPQYNVLGAGYFATDEYAQTAQKAQSFLNGLPDAEAVFKKYARDANFSYMNADAIFDYVNYMYTHNGTFQKSITPDDLARLRSLASELTWAVNGNVTSAASIQGDQMRGIAGATVAGKVLGLLEDNIASAGYTSKLNLLFGEYETLQGFFGLTGLANPNVGQDFYGLPNYGSSMTFELFSVGNSTSGSFPDPSDLWVRFLFRNGTDSDTTLTPFGLFGRGPSQTDMMWTDFKQEMSQIALQNVGDWCDMCQSSSVFCAALGSNSSLSQSPDPARSHSSGVPSPVAGVIGAFVALAVAGLILAAAMLLGGVRFHRNKAGHRRSDLGGFKGAEKLASDADLPSGGAMVTGAKGHERSSSWEMKNNADPRHSTDDPTRPPTAHLDDDDLTVNPFADPVRVRDSV